MSRTTFVSALAVVLAFALSADAEGQPGWIAEPVSSPLALTAPGAAPSELDLAEREVERATAARDRVQAELDGLSQQREAAHARVMQRFRALYRMRRAGVLPLSGGFDALLSHQARVDRLERMVVRDAHAARTLRARQSALQDEADRLTEELEDETARAGALRDARDRESAQLEILSQMIEQPAGFTAGGRDGFGIRVHGSGAPRGLAADRGRLPLPVAGSAQLADDSREGGAGLALTASSGVTVRAVHRGRVAFGAPHPAYGRLVIVDHGDNHYTVYGGLGAIGVRVGQSVDRDAVLGIVGTQPLFFQVRRGTRPLDARAWLGL